MSQTYLRWLLHIQPAGGHRLHRRHEQHEAWARCLGLNRSESCNFIERVLTIQFGPSVRDEVERVGIASYDVLSGVSCGSSKEHCLRLIHYHIV